MDNRDRFCSENSESLESLCNSLAALSTAPKGPGMWRDRYITYSLLSSFMCIMSKLKNKFSKVLRGIIANTVMDNDYEVNNVFVNGKVFYILL